MYVNGRVHLQRQTARVSRIEEDVVANVIRS